MARSVNIEAERARRNEQGREMRAAFYAGTTVEQRGKQRETKAADWTAWFHSRMDETGSNDPNEFLPEAMARLEQMNADRVITAIREFKAALKGVLK
jgi:hypothetical protein